MALPSILKALLDVAATDTVMKSVKSAIAKMPWARDSRKVQTIERKIAMLVDSASDLARSLVPEAVEIQADRLLKDFHQDLLEEGIPADDASLVRDSVRAQVRTSVLLPLQDLHRTQLRLENLEKEVLETTKREETLRGRVGEMNEEIARQRATILWSVAFAFGALVLALASVAFTALAVTRR